MRGAASEIILQTNTSFSAFLIRKVLLRQLPLAQGRWSVIHNISSFLGYLQGFLLHRLPTLQ